jgi:hypothetical protein
MRVWRDGSPVNLFSFPFFFFLSLLTLNFIMTPVKSKYVLWDCICFNFVYNYFIFILDFILIFYFIFLDLFCFSILFLNILFHLIFLFNAFYSFFDLFFFQCSPLLFFFHLVFIPNLIFVLIFFSWLWILLRDFFMFAFYKVIPVL